MAFSPITSWHIDWERVEAVTDFIFLGSRITANGDCTHEIKRRLLLGRKAVTNLDSILKNQRNHFNLTTFTKSRKARNTNCVTTPAFKKL